MIYNAAHRIIVECAIGDDSMLMYTTQFITNNGLVEKFKEYMDVQMREYQEEMSLYINNKN